MKTYTEEFKKTIVELYENGNKNKSELAREYGTSEGNVRAWIKKYGTLIHLELSLSLLSDKKHFVFVVNSLEDKRKLQELNQNLELRINQEVEKSIQKDKLHQQEQIKNAKLTISGRGAVW